tara:strand:+ start:383 stop:1390 length:1008 start_codon:yes stop_codon:yes gene_type:complete
MSQILIIPILTSLFVTLFLMPYWIKKAKSINLVWPDINKFKKPKVPGSGGIMVVLGFTIGVLTYIAFRVFVVKDSLYLIEILALLNVVLLSAGVGIIDDLLGWRKKGLRRRTRIILIAFAAIPLMAINAGKSSIFIPLLGQTDLGVLYPLLLIPIGIVGATTTFNFLAGFNGLEAGLGALVLSAISLLAYLTGSTWIAIIGLCMVAALLAFLLFNTTPAHIFPGDSLTYPVGSLIAVLAILGNFEKIAVFFFIPFILEFFLKLRGGLQKQSFGKPNKSDVLDLKYKKIYSLNHLSIYLMKKSNIKPTEKRVTLSLWAFQLIIILLGFLIFKTGAI